MNCRARTILPAVAALLCLLSSRPSGATERDCSSLTFDTDAAVDERWPGLPEEIHRALDGRADVEACARVRVTNTDGSLVVNVTLPDGRSAARPVRHRDDVLPTIDALLLLPRPLEPTPVTEVEVAPATIVVAARKSAIPRELTVRVSPPPDTAPARRLGIELSLALGAHVGDGQKSVGVGLVSLLDVSGWLVGFDARADRYDGTATAPAPMGALEIGVLAGRRMRTRELAFDLLAGPALGLRGGWRIVTANVPSGPAATPVSQTMADPTLVPRLHFGGRLTFRARSLVRTFVGVDGEVGDAGPIAPRPPDQAHGLPVWTVGLTVGATVGSP